MGRTILICLALFSASLLLGAAIYAYHHSLEAKQKRAILAIKDKSVKQHALHCEGRERPDLVHRLIPRRGVKYEAEINADNHDLLCRTVGGLECNFGQIASDKNQVMDALLEQSQIPPDYGETMIALFRDPAQDVVTRDFAVQHIGLYAQALNRRGVYDPDSADAANCRNALFDAASETSTIVAAAAFRALADVSEFDSRIDARRLDNMLIRCAIDESASLAVRVMAVQLCGERKVTSSESAIKTILDGKSAPEPLRRAASHSLKLLRGNVP